MSCSEWEARIALHIEGDAVDSAVDRHLAECAGCRQFAAGLRDSQSALKGLADEALDPAALAAVRARVLGKVDRPKDRAWVWVFAAAAALLLVTAAVMVQVRRPAPLAPPPPAVARAPQAIEQRPKPRPRAVRHIPKRVRQPERPKIAAAPKTEPMVIKFVTDDPNIVVIWLVEGKGETE